MLHFDYKSSSLSEQSESKHAISESLILKFKQDLLATLGFWKKFGGCLTQGVAMGYISEPFRLNCIYPPFTREGRFSKKIGVGFVVQNLLFSTTLPHGVSMVVRSHFDIFPKKTQIEVGIYIC